MKAKWFIILFLGLLTASIWIPVTKIRLGMTDITGTQIHEKSWLGRAPVLVKKESPLAIWCNHHDIGLLENTGFFSSITESLLGFTSKRGCGPSPAIYPFRPSLQAVWLAHEPEANIRRFITAMATANEAERERLVSVACDQALAAR